MAKKYFKGIIAAVLIAIILQFPIQTLLFFILYTQCTKASKNLHSYLACMMPSSIKKLFHNVLIIVIIICFYNELYSGLLGISKDIVTYFQSF